MEEIFKTWFKPLKSILLSKYFTKLIQHFDTQYELSRFIFNKIKIYPEKKNVFKCFNCDFDKLKVVIIGSKPFDEHSGGLAFDTKIDSLSLHPASEVIRFNIESEFYNGFNLVHDYSLEYLMEQGVLLLNESLTSTNQKDHTDLWKEFITYVITIIQSRHTGIVFCLNKNSSLIDIIDVRNQHLLLFDDPEDYAYNPPAWGFKFNKINEILNNMNGEKYEIQF